MFRKYKVKVAAILTAVILITVTLLGFGLTAGSALAALPANAGYLYYDLSWWDLETGTLIHVGTGPIPSESDFRFVRGGVNYKPRAVVVQNTEQGVEIAYSEEAYGYVERNDVATLSFTTDLIDVPFNKVAVLHTPEGNYFKIGFVRVTEGLVLFYFDQLSYNEDYEAGYQAGLEFYSETIADLEADLLAANQNITQLEANLLAANQNITQLEADLLAANQEIASLEATIDSMCTQQDLDELQAQIDILMSNNTALQAQVDTLTDEKVALQTEVEELTSSLEQLLSGLEEIVVLLGTPPGQRSSNSSYTGVFGGVLNEIIDMLIAPQGSNISENTPHGKKK